jgi:hypothetical protein
VAKSLLLPATIPYLLFKKIIMKKITRLSVILSLLFATGLASCNNYGKKIKIEGTKAEVYYKDGATESEAQKVGDYLKEAGYLPADKGASVQVTKENGEYTVRFVYNKEYYDKTDGLDAVFKEYSGKMSKEIFGGKKVNIALADDKFKDYKKIAGTENETAERTLAPGAPPGEPLDKGEFDHDEAGGVNFYWKGISDKESKIIADYIVKNGAFAGGTAEIYMTKEGDRYILQFPVLEKYRTDETTIAQIEKVAKEIKENVFADEPYSFQMVDEKLNALKSFDY